MNFSSIVSAICSSSFIVVTAAGEAHAACSRDDVEFYLGKGFTQEQITSLCASSPAPSSQAKPSSTGSTGDDARKMQAEEPANTTPVSANADLEDQKRFLELAINAKDIQLKDDSLAYTQRICIEYGDQDLFGFAPKACPDVRIMIERKGLKVTKVGKKYFYYGPVQVKVDAGVERKIIGGLKDEELKFEQRILNEIGQDDETGIPIRDGIPLDDVEEAIRQLSL